MIRVAPFPRFSGSPSLRFPGCPVVSGHVVSRPWSVVRRPWFHGPSSVSTPSTTRRIICSRVGSNPKSPSTGLGPRAGSRGAIRNPRLKDAPVPRFSERSAPGPAVHSALGHPLAVPHLGMDSAFAIPHWTRPSYLRTPLSFQAFQPASLLACKRMYVLAWTLNVGP
jgi:hypothetical protein